MKSQAQILSFLVLAIHFGCTRAPLRSEVQEKSLTPYSGDSDQVPSDQTDDGTPTTTPPDGAGGGDGTAELPPVIVSDAEVLSQVQQDASALLSSEAVKTRYFSLQVVNNGGASSQVLETERQAFKKVLNSLSTQSAIATPTSIDRNKLIYRVNLDDIGMSPAEFDKVINDHYPFNTLFIDNGKADGSGNQVNDVLLRNRLQTINAIIRMDWFNATAMLPIPYKKFMRFPNNLATFERQFLGRSSLDDIRANDVLRIGFDGSAVSSNNRVLEVHNGNNGGYYVGYDFGQQKQGQIFTAPLGPRGANARLAAQEFQEDMRSVIFTLRNGLFGYFLASAQGVAFDKSPTNLLRQVDGPEEFSVAVVNGQSCMSCHNAGLLLHDDTLLNGIASNRQLFNSADLARINTIYQAESFNQQVARDNGNYLAAMNRMGISPTDPDPVEASYRFYTRPMKLADVLNESGLTEQDLKFALIDPEFSGTLNALNNSDGTISRAIFQSVYPSLIARFNQNVRRIAPREADFVVTADCMSNDAVRMNTCIIRP